MNGQWQTIDFDPETAGADLWRQYHAYRRARWEERGDPDEPYLPDDTYAASWRLERQEEDWAQFDRVVVDGDRIIAAIGGGAPKPGTKNHATNGHIMWGSCSVLKPWRRQGIGRSWLEHTLERLPVTGATTLTASTHEPDGHAFLRAVAGEPKQLVRYSRTDFRALDWALIDRWVAEAATRAPGHTVEVFERRLPEALWPEYCLAKEEQMRHIPRDGLDMGDWSFTPKDQAERYKSMDAVNQDHNVIWVRDPEGSIVAITDVGWAPFQADQVQQFFTGVHPQARGRGLGKLIKARMLQLVRDRYGEHDLRWVRTDNATSNAAMLAINERLGFKEHKILGIYQADQGQIERFLAR